MFMKQYFILITIYVLNSCSTIPTQSDKAYLDKINFSEKIILAGIGKKNISSENLENEKVFINKSCVPDGINSSSVEVSNVKQVISEGVEKSVPLNREQIKEIVELLKTGQAKEDLKVTVFQLIKKMPDYLKLFRIIEKPHQIPAQITDIFHNPSNFIKLPVSKEAGETAKIFINPENRTFQLAILAYARMNGVNINENNLNDLYQYLETGNESDFNNLIKGGLNTFKDEYGLTDIKEISEKFHSSNKICMKNLNLYE